MEQPEMKGAGHQEGANTGEAAAIDTTVGILRAYFSKHPEMHCLLAVDPSQRDLVDEEGTGPYAGLSRAVVKIDHDDFPQAHQPYLIELDLTTPDGVTLLKDSVRLAYEDRRPASMASGLGQRVGGWLASLAPIDDVATRWSDEVLQYDEQGRACVLRFYDSRALTLIWPELTEQQQQALLGPAKVWHALDACARPCVYSRVDESRRSLSLTREQWQKIHRHGLINRALALHALAVSRQPAPAEVAAAVAAAARAEQHGLRDREDVVAFIAHALDWHPQFDRHPKVAKALRERAPDTYYTAAIDELQPEDIEAIRRGAWYDETRASS